MPFSFGFDIFTSTLGSANPTEPYLVCLSFSAAITGEVSVNPYPWTVFIPNSINPFATS